MRLADRVPTHAQSWWKRLLEAIFVSLGQRNARIERDWVFRNDLRHQSTHVAAVCYRVRDGEIQFLLVKSRAGRWTFPKGRVDGDPSRAAAAAREAFEEAGVFGRVEITPFYSYLHTKSSSFRGGSEHIVDAHLCEVAELVTPEETFRDPTWFTPEKSKQRLHEKRETRYGSELTKVVDHAVHRIMKRHHTRSRMA